MSKPYVLGVIPARGGSKGIPGKNMVPIAGQPLITYSINAGKSAQMIDRCIVSTEDAEIARLCREHGAEVPFTRPEELATDTSLAVDVIKHALDHVKRPDGQEVDIVVMLQPTSPLKTAQDIDFCLNMLIREKCDTVVSMVDVGAFHPARMYHIDENSYMTTYGDAEHSMAPRQSLEPVYIRNGAVYASWTATVRKHNSLIGPDCRAYIMPPERSVNIDAYEDLVLAEYHLGRKKKSSGN